MTRTHSRSSAQGGPARRLGVVAALLALLALTAAQGAAAHRHGGTLLVDDDKQQCSDAQYTTIQSAIDAAQPGDTIRVCPGTYAAATVAKAGLTLVGSTRALSPDDCVAGSRGSDPQRDSLVSGTGSAPGFAIGASDVTIAGFSIHGGTAGVHVPNDVSGTRIARNLLQENTIGVYLNSSGSHASRVDRNCFRANNAAGAASGNGVYSDAGLSRASINGNTFTGHANASVILLLKGGTIDHVAVKGNRMVKDASIILANLVDSTVDRNRSDSSNGSAIFFAGGSSNVSVRRNVVRDCAFTGINVRYLPASAGGYDVTAPNTRLAIVGNKVSGCGDGGIRLRDGSGSSLVSGNDVAGNGTGATKGDGIALEDADGNRLDRNSSEDNGRDGFRVDASSTGNVIVRNRASGNGEHDCHDDSSGSGTAGTASTWSGDVGATENRDGLCAAKKEKGGGKHERGGRHEDHGGKGAARDEVVLCHVAGSGSYVEVNVAAPGAGAHLDKRDDVAPDANGNCPDRLASSGGERDVKGERHEDRSSKHAEHAPRGDDDGHGGKGRKHGHSGS